MYHVNPKELITILKTKYMSTIIFPKYIHFSVDNFNRIYLNGIHANVDEIAIDLEYCTYHIMVSIFG